MKRYAATGLLATFAIILFAAFPQAQAIGTITTIAGGSGDGGPATSVAVAVSNGVAVDAAGNLYIAEPHHNRIRKVGADGIITTVAGTGQRGYSGDGGPATDATLRGPLDIAIGPTGHLYILDLENSVVRKVDAFTQEITTVVGDGCATWFGGCNQAGSGLATEISLFGPSALAVDGAGNLYISEVGCAGFSSFCKRRVSKVDTAGYLTHVAGSDALGSGTEPDNVLAVETPILPNGMAVGTDGTLYISDRNRVRKVHPVTGVITTFAGSGAYLLEAEPRENIPATAASFWEAGDLAVDPNDNVYVSDRFNARVRKVDGSSGLVTTVAGTGCRLEPYMGPCPVNGGNLAVNESLGALGGIALTNDGMLYVADPGNATVHAVNLLNGQIGDAAGTGFPFFGGDGGAATAAQLGAPEGVASDRDGNVYIADSWNSRIRRVDAASGAITTVAGNGREGEAVDGGPAIEAAFRGLGQIALDSVGNIFVVDINNLRIRRIDAVDGTISTFAGSGIWASPESNSGRPATEAWLSNVLSLAVDASDNVYIADGAEGRVYKVGSDNIIWTIAGATPNFYCDFDCPPPSSVATEAILGNPRGVAVDAAGNVYIAEHGSGRVRKVTAGFISTVVEAGVLTGPTALTLDGFGNLYITEPQNHRVWLREPNGVLTVLAGTGVSGFGGDGGPAGGARLDFPQQVAVDGGRLLIADSRNYRIRAVAIPRFVAPTTTALVSNLNPAGSGQAVTFTATVASAHGTPGGVVTFKNGAATLGTASLSGGQAAFTTSALGAGSHAITAVYDGADSFEGSTSSPLTQSVVSTGYTPPGTNVPATPVDTTTGTSPVSISFGNVNAGGVTTLTTTTTWFPAPPASFRLGVPPVYYDIDTAATFTGSATVCINYTGQTFFFAPSQLLHLENGVWVNRTVSHNPATKTICASVTSFSPFVIVEASYLQLSVTPSTAPRGGSVSIAGSIRNPSASASQVVTVKLATSGSCAPAVLMPFPVMLAPNQTRTVSIPLPIRKQACVGTYTLTLTGWIGSTQMGEASATLTVTP